MNSAETLLEVAVRASVTDVVMTPGTGLGNLHLRSGFRSVHSQPLPAEALQVLARQLSRLADLPEQAPLLQLQVSSFAHGTTRVRLTRMLTEGGPVVRLRLQLPGLLERARLDFEAGRYGGTEVAPFLELDSGVLVVSGPVASGKTSALSHLLARLSERVLVVSEARELSPDLEVLPTGGRPPGDLRVELERREGRVVALDEMDEAAKIELARALGPACLGPACLVLMSLTAPDLAAAIRRLRAGGLEPEHLLGVFRVTWVEDEGQVRRPSYRWYPVGRSEAGLCPVCGQGRPADGPCPACGVPPLKQVLDRVILERMNSPEGYRALDRLEEEWV